MTQLHAPRPRQRRNSENTKKRLLDAAEAEFAIKGYDGARLGAIASAAGAQQALIHHYYGDKEGLYRAVVERAIETLSKEGWDILERMAPRADVRAFVEAFVRALLSYFSSHAPLLAIFRAEASAGGGFSRDLLERHTKPVFDAVVAELESLARRGEVRADVDARHLCVSVCGMCAFPFYDEAFLAVIWPVDMKNPAFLEARERDIVELVMTRIQPRP